MGNMTVFSGQTAPFLALWDDVIEGSPRPKLNGYQRPIPGGACGAKGLGMFARTPVSGGLPDLTSKPCRFCNVSHRIQRVKGP